MAIPMVRLLRDRYFAYDAVHGCDLATGDEIRLDELPDGWSPPVPPPEALAPLIEVLRDSRDGNPRWITAEARGACRAAALARAAADEGLARGFVPVRAELYARHRDALVDDLRERSLLLLATSTTTLGIARAALVDAAARSPRPHVLLTFQPPSVSHGSYLRAGEPLIVREARAAYAVEPLSTDVA